MISISGAGSMDDFEIAARFCRAFGNWDALVVQPYGIAPERVIELFHAETTDSLATRFNSTDAALFIARWEGMPAGCVAFDRLDDTTAELHKFFVDPEFRGKGIGRALISKVLAEVGKTDRKRIVLHTAVYMTNAISLYQVCDFAQCPPFRSTPEDVRHTDFFMARAI